MIFYFTGTGNSLYAAKKLADAGEEIVSVVEAVRSRSFHYTLKEDEKLGFVFPVYFYTVSDPVLELVRNLTVENAGFALQRRRSSQSMKSLAVSSGMAAPKNAVLNAPHRVVGLFSKKPHLSSGPEMRVDAMVAITPNMKPLITTFLGSGVISRL